MKSTSSTVKVYFLLSLAILAVMAVGRLFEIATLAIYHGLNQVGFAYFTGALYHDLQWSLIGALVLWPMHILAGRNFHARQSAITALLITAIGISNILLISYFGATLTPLGPEFWAYSIWEMSSTVMASERLNLWSLLAFVLLAATFFFLAKAILSKKIISDSLDSLQPKWTLPIAAFIIFLPMSWIASDDETASPDYQPNKLAYFISSGINAAFSEIGSQDFEGIEKEFPFLHPAQNQSNLAPFFKDFSEPPNIVFLIVESLGGEFLGNGQWSGFAPNLDSLARDGLYWKNGLSLSGRTFGMMPSLFGSLPPGRNGFMDLGPDYPNHLTLISLLKERGYHTSFYSGFNTYFDKLDFFLQYQNIDFVLNKQIIEEKYAANTIEGSENYWGYDDKSMLGIASSILDTASAFPRLDIYHTLQSHSPFTVPNQETYRNKFDRILNRLELTESRKETYQQYRNELTTLLYADEAVGTFMDTYRKRSNYENTIFVITGDHWLIPVPMSSQISRYHVPIIIYSPLLNEPESFNSVNTHVNITPSLINLLDQATSFSFPDSVHWVGSPMDTSLAFRNTHTLALMKNKNQVTDYLHKEFYLSDGQLFRLEEDLKLAVTKYQEMNTQLSDGLQQFNLRSRYALTNNKLYPGTSNENGIEGYDFLTTYNSLFNRMDEMGLNADQQFQEARKFAFQEEYDKARAIVRRLLLEHPDFHDAKLLMGRTFAWQGKYDRAREIFGSVQNRYPEYYDTYNALFDVEYWDGNTDKALEVINEGLKRHPAHEQFLEKKIRALASLNRITEAKKVFDVLREHHPNSSRIHELDALFPD